MCVKCDVCCGFFHQDYTGLTYDIFTVLFTIVKHTGWVCQECRLQHNSQLKSLKCAVARINEEVADLHVSIAGLKEQLLDSGNNQFVQATVNSNSAKPNVTDLSVEVSRTCADILRRKKNVVITGLPEAIDVNGENTPVVDEEHFTRFCEEHLDVKPAIARSGCKRLGKATSSRPRRLLVHLNSEASASSLISAAKSLRRSDNPDIVTSLYINPDLSPAEAKLAFERRQRKRELAATKHRRPLISHESDGMSTTVKPTNNDNNDLSSSPAMSSYSVTVPGLQLNPAAVTFTSAANNSSNSPSNSTSFH